MNNWIILLLISTVFISTVQAIACYTRYDRCKPTAFCLNDTMKRNCSGSEQDYCYKEVNILGGATRGCAELDFCNASAFLATRYCCDTDYCNDAISEKSITWFMMITVITAMVSVVIIK